ncbi:MAG: transcription-repair coupling factor [Candidatus Eisenbacteria bacterium]|nr:transcription-repair coupling factor [Candidatus Eisenbacteria bacterium]
MRAATSDRIAESLEGRLIERLARAEALRHLGRHLLAENLRQPVQLGGLSGSARTLVLGWLAQEAAAHGRGPVVCILPDSSSLEDAREDLKFLLGRDRVAIFPDLGVPIYGAQHPKVPQRAGRIETLAALLSETERPWVVLTTLPAFLKRLPPAGRLRRHVLPIRVGQTVEQEELLQALVHMGYENQPLVGEYGDMSRRGGIMDIYTFGLENPLRLEWDGDEIASLREFDVFNQRSIQQRSQAVILPMWELQIDPDDWERLGERLQSSRHTDRRADKDARRALEFLRSETAFLGMEWLAPLFGIAQVSLLDYAGERGIVVFDDPLALSQNLKGLQEEINAAYESVAQETHAGAEDSETPWMSLYGRPEEVFSMVEDLSALTGGQAAVYLDPAKYEEPGDSPDDLPMHFRRAGVDLAGAAGEPGIDGEAAAPAPQRVRGTEATALRLTLRTRPQERFNRNLELTQEYIQRLRDRGLSVWILCDTANHRDRLQELMAETPASFEIGNLAGGFECPEVGLAVLTDHEIFRRLRRRTAGRRFSRGISLKELLAMGAGDFVVHIDHGIGIYRGIKRLVVNGQETDCMLLEYAGGDKLYIPVDQLDLVQRYSAEEGVRPQLSRLGSGQWQKTKARVKKSVKEMASQLLRTYAIRKSRPGYSFGPDTVWQTEMEASFPYEETPDQADAIEQVRADMERAVPMERLICGDVGYGKTEVALRAAFKAALEGKQVAILVPTTLLAQQHYETFRERLEKYPVRVEMLSRFRSPKERKSVVADLKAGKVDIVIGTHRLVQKDVTFKDLGLIIVDEEHRFGVAHKERLKQLRETVDTLSMTATPIPRTLHMSLMGATDMSIIRTPPRNRQSVQTEIVEFREDVIAYALMREADRGGQSFLVHNRVESIDAVANYVRGIVPHLRVAVAHGQMRERQLESIMKKFLEGEFDVLVSTMIIEAGLDMPNVNTILVNRVDTFGLAQLYQLRGRVGRSARKAYAYLMLPSNRVLTEQAQKRLKAIEEFDDLGSGFQLALRDLEIRGAGNILGSEQHGFIVNIGFDLYTRLLEEAVRELKGLPAPERISARIVTDAEAYLADTYIPHPKEKMNLYKSLADTVNLEQVEELVAEIEDRFGKLPEAGENLIELRKLRIRASRAGVATVTLRGKVVELEMDRALKRDEVQRLVSGMPMPVEFQSHGRHHIRARRPTDVTAVQVAGMLLDALGQ